MDRRKSGSYLISLSVPRLGHDSLQIFLKFDPLETSIGLDCYMFSIHSGRSLAVLDKSRVGPTESGWLKDSTKTQACHIPVC